MQVPVGEAMIGRVVDALGRPIVPEVDNLTKTFPVQGKGFIRREKGTMTAVDHASFQIHKCLRINKRLDALF